MNNLVIRDMNSVFQKDRCNHCCRHRNCDHCGGNCCGPEPMDIEPHHLFGVIDPSQMNELANSLLEEYYQRVSNVGWNSVLFLYVPNAVISCNTNVYSGGHEFLNALSNEYIRRANFGNLLATWSLIDESKMVVTVFGEIQFVGFTGDCSGVGHFTDTFILKAFPDQTYGITHHFFYFT